jgi:hypothetical protein
MEVFAAVTKDNQFVRCGGWDGEVEEPEQDSACKEVLDRYSLSYLIFHLFPLLLVCILYCHYEVYP